MVYLAQLISVYVRLRLRIILKIYNTYTIQYSYFKYIVNLQCLYDKAVSIFKYGIHKLVVRICFLHARTVLQSYCQYLYVFVVVNSIICNQITFCCRQRYRNTYQYW